MMINCQKASQLLSEKRDRSLSLKEQLSLNFHVLVCDACKKIGDNFKLISILFKSANLEGNYRLSPEAKNRILDKINLHS